MRLNCKEILDSWPGGTGSAGSPVVNVVDLGDGHMCAETADSAIINEDITGCCKWAIKYETARQWLDNKEIT